MDQFNLENLLSGLGGSEKGDQQGALVGGLRSIIGLAGDGPLQDAVEEFLGGKGELHETARTASASSGAAESIIVSYLTTKFKLSPTIANLIAPLLLKLLPSLLGKAEKETEKKPKKKPKKKPSTSSAEKKESSSSKPKAKPKPKPKTEAKPKPKTETKPKAKPKPKTEAKP